MSKRYASEVVDGLMGNYSAENEELARQMGYEKFIEFLPLSIFILTLMVIGLIGNFFVCIFYGYKVPKTPFTRLIVAVAIVDATICMLMPRNVIDFWYTYQFENSLLCKLHKFLNYSTVFCSGFLILMIGSFRFRMVCQPLRKQFTLRHANIAFIIAVLFGIIISLPVLFLLEAAPHDIILNENKTILGCDCGFSQDESLQIYISITNVYMCVIFALCFITLCVLYGTMVYKILQCRKVHLSLRGETAKLSFYNKTERRIRRSARYDRPKHDIRTLINNRCIGKKSYILSSIRNSTKSTLMYGLTTKHILQKSMSDGHLERFCKGLQNSLLNIKPKGSFHHKTMLHNPNAPEISHKNDDVLKLVLDDKMKTVNDGTEFDSKGTELPDTLTETLSERDYDLLSQVNESDFTSKESSKVNKREVSEGDQNRIVRRKLQSIILNPNPSFKSIDISKVNLSKMVLHMAKHQVTFNNQNKSTSYRKSHKRPQYSKAEERFRRNSMLSASAVNQKLTMMFFGITVVFIASYLPYFVEIFTRDPEEARTGVLIFWRQFLMRTYLLNSAVNPFIYGLFNIKFRLFVKRNFFCCCK